MPGESGDRGVPQNSSERLESILADDACRHAVEYLQTVAEPVASLDEVAEHVAEQRDDPTVDCLDDVAVRLHHMCLPRLDEAGVVDYDSRSHVVRYWDVAFVADGPSEALQSVEATE